MLPLATAVIKAGVFLAWAFPTVSKTRRMLELREQRKGVSGESPQPTTPDGRGNVNGIER